MCGADGITIFKITVLVMLCMANDQKAQRRLSLLIRDFESAAIMRPHVAPD